MSERELQSECCYAEVADLPRGPTCVRCGTVQPLPSPLPVEGGREAGEATNANLKYRLDLAHEGLKLIYEATGLDWFKADHNDLAEHIRSLRQRLEAAEHELRVSKAAYDTVDAIRAIETRTREAAESQLVEARRENERWETSHRAHVESALRLIDTKKRLETALRDVRRLVHPATPEPPMLASAVRIIDSAMSQSPHDKGSTE